MCGMCDVEQIMEHDRWASGLEEIIVFHEQTGCLKCKTIRMAEKALGVPLPTPK